MSILWAALSGLCFSLISVAIRGGAARGVEPRLLLVASMPPCGLALLPEVLADGAPAWVWLAGVTAGIEQFVLVLVMRQALRHGPMAPLWSAQMLGFVLVVLWGWWWLGEAPSVGQWLAVAAALASVATAALAVGDAPGQGTSGRMAPYALAIVTIWILSGATGATWKWLAEQAIPGGDAMSAWGSTAFLAMYITISLGAAADLALRPVRAGVGATTGYALLAAGGSLGGTALLRLCLDAPAATVFTVNTAAALLAAAFLSWLGWRELPSRTGWISLACAMAAVVAAAW